MVEFWKRFPPNAVAALLAASSPVEDQDDHNDQNGGGSGENKGTLIMDATCSPAGNPGDSDDEVGYQCIAQSDSTSRTFTAAIRSYSLKNGVSTNRIRSWSSTTHMANTIRTTPTAWSTR